MSAHSVRIPTRYRAQSLLAGASARESLVFASILDPCLDTRLLLTCLLFNAGTNMPDLAIGCVLETYTLIL